MSTKNSVMGLLNDLLCILVRPLLHPLTAGALHRRISDTMFSFEDRNGTSEYVFGYLPFRSGHLVVSRIG